MRIMINLYYEMHVFILHYMKHILQLTKKLIRQKIISIWK